MRRTPLTRKTPLRGTATLRRSPMKKGRSKKLAVPKEIYADVIVRDGGCVARRSVPEVTCYGRLDPHHVLRRSQGGQDTADNLVTLCRAHHDWVHANPASARQLQLLKSPTTEEKPQ